MRKSQLVLLIILICLVTISCSNSFCDYYADHIYGFINQGIGSVTALFPIALGELLMYLGAILVLLLPVLGILYVFVHRNGFRRFVKRYAGNMFSLLLVVFIVYCTNWLFNYRSDTLRVTDDERNTFTEEEVVYVRNLLVEEINALSKEVERDAEGQLIYGYDEEEIFKAMTACATKYPRLAGHYSPAKTALCSDFLEFMNIGGYNYIYTMEPTLSSYLYPLSTPTLYAHELAHYKGYYKENEANFICFITLSQSENAFLRYCAYIDIYSWINGEFNRRYDKNNPLFAEAPRLSEQVYEDILRSNEEGALYYETHMNPFLEKHFARVSDEIADTGWNIQSEILKENTYSGVTLMVLQYYLR